MVLLAVYLIRGKYSQEECYYRPEQMLFIVRLEIQDSLPCPDHKTVPMSLTLKYVPLFCPVFVSDNFEWAFLLTSLLSSSVTFYLPSFQNPFVSPKAPPHPPQGP